MPFSLLLLQHSTVPAVTAQINPQLRLYLPGWTLIRRRSPLRYLGCGRLVVQILLHLILISLKLRQRLSQGTQGVFKLRYCISVNPRKGFSFFVVE
uniref:Uncharacterized protein n=1 Tax=Nelumbo nucifera TaxID=4432 RepID=A0A822ZKR1_NELNU|nr:TPA_asm: hypothetical protein HUJ06_003982 [Nelumbo nucifera]